MRNNSEEKRGSIVGIVVCSLLAMLSVTFLISNGILISGYVVEDVIDGLIMLFINMLLTTPFMLLGLANSAVGVIVSTVLAVKYRRGFRVTYIIMLVFFIASIAIMFYQFNLLWDKM